MKIHLEGRSFLIHSVRGFVDAPFIHVVTERFPLRSIVQLRGALKFANLFDRLDESSIANPGLRLSFGMFLLPRARMLRSEEGRRGACIVQRRRNQLQSEVLQNRVQPNSSLVSFSVPLLYMVSISNVGECVEDRLTRARSWRACRCRLSSRLTCVASCENMNQHNNRQARNIGRSHTLSCSVTL